MTGNIPELTMDTGGTGGYDGNLWSPVNDKGGKTM